MLNVLAQNRIYERFPCFDSPPPTSHCYSLPPPELGVERLCWLVSMVTPKKSHFLK